MQGSVSSSVLLLSSDLNECSFIISIVPSYKSSSELCRVGRDSSYEIIVLIRSKSKSLFENKPSILYKEIKETEGLEKLELNSVVLSVLLSYIKWLPGGCLNSR